MRKADYHLVVCNSFRLTGERQGLCSRKGSTDLLALLESELGDRGINAIVSSTSCLKQCASGPLMVVYPPGWWYGSLDETKLLGILDALEEGRPAEDLLLGS